MSLLKSDETVHAISLYCYMGVAKILIKRVGKWVENQRVLFSYPIMKGMTTKNNPNEVPLLFPILYFPWNGIVIQLSLYVAL